MRSRMGAKTAVGPSGPAAVLVRLARLQAKCAAQVRQRIRILARRANAKLRITTAAGTRRRRVAPEHHAMDVREHVNPAGRAKTTAYMIKWIVRAPLFILGWMIQLTQRVENAFISLFKKSEYVRHGSCQSCGACCKAIGIELPECLRKRRWAIRYFSWWHGYRYNFEFHGMQENLLVYSCRYLTAENRCSIYRWRPRLCREFPITPMRGVTLLHKGCGFHFRMRGSASFAEVLERKQRRVTLPSARQDSGQTQSPDCDRYD